MHEGWGKHPQQAQGDDPVSLLTAEDEEPS